MLAIWLGKSLLAGKMSVPVLKIPVLGVLVAVFIVLYILATVFRLRRFKCFWLVSAFRALQFCYSGFWIADICESAHGKTIGTRHYCHI